MRRLKKRQRRKIKRIFRNSLIVGSVFGAMLMLFFTAPAMKQNSVSGRVMCTLATIYIIYFLAANYIVPFYGGHYHFWNPSPGEESEEDGKWQR